MRCNAPGPEGPGCSATHTQNPTESHQVHPRAATGSLVLVCFRVGARVSGLPCERSTVVSIFANIAWKSPYQFDRQPLKLL